MEIEECEKCGLPFKVFEQKMAMPGTREKENITCPYCGFSCQETSNGLWLTYKLTDEQIQEYLKKK